MAEISSETGSVTQSQKEAASAGTSQSVAATIFEFLHLHIPPREYSWFPFREMLNFPSILSFMEQKIGSGGSNSAPSASMHDTADEKEDQVFDIKMVELCTTRKKKLREETDAWLQACSFSSSIYHPVKIGTTESSVAAWTKRFEEISVRERSSCVWAC